MKNKKNLAEIELIKVPVLVRIWNFIEPYRKRFIAAGLVIIIVMMSVIGWQSYKSWREDKAFSLLEIAKEESDYQKVIEDYSETDAGGLAMIQLGEMKRKRAKFSSAREIYQKFLIFNSDSIYAPFVKNLVGECYFEEEKFDEAQAIFDALVKDSNGANHMTTLARINLGRTLALKGETPKSLEIYNSLKADPANQVWRDVIEAGIRKLDNNVQK